MRNILWSGRRDVEHASRNHRAWLGLCDTRRLDSCDRPRTRVIAHARFPLNRDRSAARRPIVSCAPMRRGRAPGSLFALEGRRRPPPFLAARARRLARPLRTQGQGHSGPGFSICWCCGSAQSRVSSGPPPRRTSDRWLGVVRGLSTQSELCIAEAWSRPILRRSVDHSSDTPLRRGG
jgi:hypothetical protein